MNKKQVSIFLGTALLFSNAQADEPVKRHGRVVDKEDAVQVEGGFTVTAQSSSDDRIDDEIIGSFDLVATIPSGKGEWVAYIEGNTTPGANGLSSVLGEVNGDAGSALDRDGKGRLQVSEFHYTREFGENSYSIGLINPACVLDSSEVANDETSQFLSGSFVNNPTIAFPDYALATCIHFEEGKSRPGFNLLISSSHGLGDNPNVSYSELVDVNADGKGVFIGTEAYWTGRDSLWRVGVWTSTADHDYLDGSTNIDDNYGAYLTTDHSFGEHNINLRLGIANDEVSEVASFASIALETIVADNTLGLAIGKTGVSDKLGAGTDDTSQAEVYYSFDLENGLNLTPSVQWISNSGFDTTGTTFDKDITVVGLRATYSF